MTLKDIPEYRRVTLTLQDDGSYLATWPLQRHRFLLSDGRTIDVVTSRDDSDLRGALLEATGAERIEGSVRLKAPEPPEPPKALQKRRVSRKS